MTDQSAEPTPGPYDIWGEDEEAPGVPCIEIGRGKVPSREAKSLCWVRSTFDEQDDFVLTPEDWANARLFAASWATAAERDRLRQTVIDAEKRCIELLQERDRLVKALELFADENHWMEWDDSKGAYLIASFKGAGKPWQIVQSALDEARKS